MNRLLRLALCVLLALCLAACAAAPAPEQTAPAEETLTLLPADGPVAELFAPEKESEHAQAPPAEDEADPAEAAVPEAAAPEAAVPDEGGSYDSAADVALYLHVYGRLPGNYITKKEARELGWTGGSVERVAPGKCIGGDRFGNYEGQLPDAKGRRWTECDIDTLGRDSRGAKRVIFSNDGLIYYTDDHYESFTLLYGEE